METAVKKLYEAMFLVDSTESSQNWDEITGTIKTILERAEAEIVSIKKWDVRKLAYKIDGKNRGAYILCYFRAAGERLQDIEKDVQLSEQIMRVLILVAETREKEALEENATLPESEARKVGDESAPAKAEGKTSEIQPPEKERETETQEDIPAAPTEKEEQKADLEAVEKVSTPQKAEQTGEPEQSGAPAAADAIEPEQPDEPTAVDVIEPEQLGQSETEKDF